VVVLSVSTSSSTCSVLHILLVYYYCHIIIKCKTRLVVEVVVTMCKAKACRLSRAKIYCLTWNSTTSSKGDLWKHENSVYIDHNAIILIVKP
jgi:hypothetical protein